MVDGIILSQLFGLSEGVLRSGWTGSAAYDAGTAAQSPAVHAPLVPLTSR